MAYSLSAVYCTQPMYFTACVLKLPIETLHLPAYRLTDSSNNISYSLVTVYKIINTAKQSINKNQFCVREGDVFLNIMHFLGFSVRLICCQAGGCFCNSGRLQKLIYPNNQVLLGHGGWDTEMVLVGKAAFWSLECFGWLRAGDWSGGIIFTDPWDF